MATKLSNKHFVSLRSLESIEQYFDECNRKVLKTLIVKSYYQAIKYLSF